MAKNAMHVKDDEEIRVIQVDVCVRTIEGGYVHGIKMGLNVDRVYCDGYGVGMNERG